MYRVSAQHEPPAQRRPAREEALGVPGAQRSAIVTRDLHETTGDSDTAVAIASDARHIPRLPHGREIAHRLHKPSTQHNVSGTTRTTDTTRAICTLLVTVAPDGLPLSKSRYVSSSQHLRTTGLTRRRLKGITSREMNPSDRPDASLWICTEDRFGILHLPQTRNPKQTRSAGHSCSSPGCSWARRDKQTASSVGRFTCTGPLRLRDRTSCAFLEGTLICTANDRSSRRARILVSIREHVLGVADQPCGRCPAVV